MYSATAEKTHVGLVVSLTVDANPIEPVARHLHPALIVAGFDGLPGNDMFDTSIFIISRVGRNLRILPACDSCETRISL
jgi:hypothetical protein